MFTWFIFDSCLQASKFWHKLIFKYRIGLWWWKILSKSVIPMLYGYWVLPVLYMYVSLFVLNVFTARTVGQYWEAAPILQIVVASSRLIWFENYNIGFDGPNNVSCFIRTARRRNDVLKSLALPSWPEYKTPGLYHMSRPIIVSCRTRTKNIWKLK